MKNFLWILLIALLTMPIYAQADDELIAILLDHNNQSFILINEDGSEEIFPLIRPQPDLNRWGNTPISNDTRYVGACWTVSDNSFTNDYRFIVQEIRTGEIILEKDYADLISCTATAFNIDSTQIAISVIDEMGWTLEVYDLNSGDLVHDLGMRQEISDHYFEITDGYFGNGVYFRIEVYHFDNETIVLGASPFIAMGTPDSFPAFTWNLEDNSLVVAEHAGNNLGDNLFATGETAFPILNEDYDAVYGAFWSHNEVRVFTAQSETTIYRNTEQSMSQTHFINSGEHVAILIDALESRIEILSRDGSRMTTDTIPTASSIQIGNHGEAGIILWSDSIDDMYITHLQMLQIDGTLSDIWATEASENRHSLELVWTQPLPLDASYPNFATLED